MSNIEIFYDNIRKCAQRKGPNSCRGCKYEYENCIVRDSPIADLFPCEDFQQLLITITHEHIQMNKNQTFDWLKVAEKYESVNNDEKALDHVCRFISDSWSGIRRYDEIEMGKYLRTLSDCVDSNKELIYMFKVLYKALYLATIDYDSIESGSKTHQRIIKQYIDCAAEIVKG